MGSPKTDIQKFQAAVGKRANLQDVKPFDWEVLITNAMLELIERLEDHGTSSEAAQGSASVS